MSEAEIDADNPIPQIFIALFKRPGSRQHHPAFLISPDGNLRAAHDRRYQIYQAAREEVVDDDDAVFKHWQTRHGQLSITNSALDGTPIVVPFCAIALPPLVPGRRLDIAQWWLESLPAEPGAEAESSASDLDPTAVVSQSWNATRWVLRGVDTLVTAGLLPDKWQLKHPEHGVIDFKHPSWPQLLALAIAHRGDEAVAQGPLVKEIRVMEL